jgi:hypothetical protein
MTAPLDVQFKQRTVIEFLVAEPSTFKRHLLFALEIKNKNIIINTIEHKH